MGEKITRPATAAEVSRAKQLKEALHRGTPSFSRTGEGLSAPTLDDPEIQKAYLEQLVECAPKAISILDGQHRIVRINGEFTRMFGFSPEEAIGRRIDSLIVPPDRSSETQWIGDVLRQGQKVSLETKRQRKGGMLVDVFVSGAAVVVGGRASRCLRLVPRHHRTET